MNAMSHIKTVLLVTIVSALIWIFAESETLQPGERSIRLVLNADDRGTRVLEAVDASGKALTDSSIEVAVWIEGSAAALKSLDLSLRAGALSLKPGMTGLELSSEPRDIRISDVLREAPLISEAGVTIIRTSPEFIRLRADELVTQRLRVDVPIPGGESDGLPESRPADVEVTMTKAAAQSLGASPTVVARIDANVWSKLIPGKRETVSGVRLELPAGLAGIANVRLNPAAVDVNITVKSKTATVKLDSVPVQLRVAPEEFNNWKIDVPQSDRFLSDVTVSGPAEYIAQLSTQTVRLVAVVPLSFEELEKRIAAKEAVFIDLPAGVKVEVANRTVRMTISPRNTP
jgi:hypothetical protein